MPRLSALIVNYDSGRFAAACAESLRAEWIRGGRALDELELVVVDNASPSDQGASLARLEALGARVLRAAQNGGYARAIAAAFASARGEVIAVLNPDVFFPRGSLAPLLEQVVRDGVGAVGPSTFVDPGCTLALPPNVMPTPEGETRAALARTLPAAAQARAAARARAALAAWTASEPRDVELLSGACLFLRRDVVDRLGVLLDERYPLYYEDTDLCLRLGAAGLRLVHEPRSRVVHHWARSTGVGADFERRAAARWRTSRAAFFERWHGTLAARFVRALDDLAAAWPLEHCASIPGALEPLGVRDDELEVGLSREADFVLELAVEAGLGLAAGLLGSGRVARIEPAAFEWLFAGRYFVRALDRASGEPLGAWTFDKHASARGEPLSVDSATARAGA
jgi:N-acetylglucosaminyl-diphospho-decaprenol L-rhamnosyltransferase